MKANITKDDITIEFDETVDGCSTWYIELNGETVGDFSREPYSRFAAGARMGLAFDRDRPLTYTSNMGWDCGPLKGFSFHVADGTHLRVAKKLIIAAAVAYINSH